MCGILGAVNRQFGEDLLDLIRHRGPDDGGLAEIAAGRHNVCLGNRRLAILDLSPAGRQPMFTACGQCAITFNGEIYNHLDLRQGLRENFRGHSDTETILYLIARRGINAVAQFNGIFGLAFADSRDGKLYLARDPFGIKPLYYAASDDFFAFASEIRPLLRFVDGEVDPDALAELLRLRYLPAPDTLFKQIRKVRPGHIVEVDLRRPRLAVREYPFIAALPEVARPPARAEAVERYGALVEQAVRRQLLSDVEVGVLLSGGVDSALVARFAQRHAPYQVKAFTVGFTDRDDADEIAEACETARLIGLDHAVVRIGVGDFLEMLPRIISIVEEPLATTSVFPMYYLAGLASARVKVVLSGQGADEASGGYRRYQGELLRPFVPRFLVPFARKAAELAAVRSDAVLRGLAAFAERDDVRRFLAVYTVFSPAQIRKLIGREETRAADRISYFFELLGCAARRQSAERMMSLDLRMNLADDLLLYTDKITMRHSIECRVPLLDHDLVRFVESLPAHYRLGLLRGKLLHKEFAGRVLPASIVRRKKKGFLSPTGSWFRENTAVREVLLERGSRFSSYFDSAEVRRILDEQSAGMNREREIFLLLSMRYWMSECLGAARAAKSAQLI